MKVLRVVLALMLALSVLSVMSFARVDKALIIGGPHDLRSTVAGSGGTKTGVNGPSYALCNYCHVAHKFSSEVTAAGGSAKVPGQLLWNHTLSSSTAYSTYTSVTMQNKDIASLQPSGTPDSDVQNPSILCMSCHDGTVALNSTYTGLLGNSGNGMPLNMVINPADANKTHPVNFTYDTTLAQATGMRLPSGPYGVDVNSPSSAVVPLFAGKMQCATCHEPHRGGTSDATGHLLFRNFKAVYTDAQGSWCLYCHSDGSNSVM